MDISQTLAINSMLRPAYRNRFIRQALKACKSNDSPEAAHLKQIIDKRKIKVRGLGKYPSQALERDFDALAQKVTQAVANDAELFIALLQVWITTLPELDNATRSELAKRQLPVFQIQSEVLSEPAEGLWFETIVSVCKSRQESDVDEVALMVTCLTGWLPQLRDREQLEALVDRVNTIDYRKMINDNAALMVTDLTGGLPQPQQRDREQLGMYLYRTSPVDYRKAVNSDTAASDDTVDPRVQSNDSGEHAVAVEITVWDEFFLALSGIAADRDIWEAGVPEHFLAQVQLLIAQKRHERDFERKRLVQALVSLAENYAAALRHVVEQSDLSRWSAASCPANATMALSKQIEQLQALLDHHQEMRRLLAADLPRSVRRAYTQERGHSYEHERDDLEETIVALHALLEQALMTDELPSTANTQPASTATTDETALEPDQEVLTAITELAASGLDSAEKIADSTTAQTVLDDALPTLDPASVDAVAGVERSDDDGVAETVEDQLAEASCTSDVVRLLRRSDSNEAWDALVWALVNDNDLVGAHWIAWSRSACSEPTQLPDWLIAVAQGALWLSAGATQYRDDLQAMVAKYQPNTADEQCWLATAAAILLSLTAPSKDLLTWLTIAENGRSFPECIAPFKQFITTGVTLRAADLENIVGRDQREAAISATARAARECREQAIKRRDAIWRELAEKGEFSTILEAVIADRRASLDKIQHMIGFWNDRDYALKYFYEKSHELTKGHAGAGTEPEPQERDHFLRNVETTCEVIQRWCDLVRDEAKRASTSDWEERQVRELRTAVQKMLPAVDAQISQIASDQPLGAVASGATVMRQALIRLRTLLKLPTAAGVIPDELCEQRLFLTAPNLEIALARRLLFVANLDLDDALQPTDLANVAAALRDALPLPAIRTALEHWLTREDYRFIDDLSANMSDEATSADVNRMLQEARRGSIAALRGDAERCRIEIELSYGDGLLTDAEHAAHTGRREQIDPATELKFERARQQLKDIRADLDTARRHRLAVLESEWPQLQQLIVARGISEADQQHLNQMMREAFERGDTRAIEEHLDRAQRVIGGETVNLSWLGDSAPADESFAQLQDRYFQSVKPLRDALHQGIVPALSAIRSRQLFADLSFGEPADGVVSALESWRQLRQQPGSTNQPLLKRIFAFLGFDECAIQELIPSPNKPTPRTNWTYAQITLPAGLAQSRPIVQFGSEGRPYHLVCVWAGKETLTGIMRRVRPTPRYTLLWYFGVLTVQQWRDITRLGKDKDHPIALVALDETTLLFLAQEHERDKRLRLLLHCSLPYTTLIPYTPFEAGRVPPEMFYGRQNMVRDLLDLRGSCLVYGGRQLGKSALLQEVRRQFSKQPEQYAYVEDINTIGETLEEPPSLLWGRLREICKTLKLISSQVKTDKAEEIASYIRKSLEQNPGRRVLILFDEADDFLDADARDRFHVVFDLRRLMTDTERRFKVVFAGLHSVQRFAGIPNQPLAHFGDPIRLGPLDSRAAQDLIVEPLAALGYRFVDRDSILRILSYTNYHAGLIQIFCDNLLKHFHEDLRQTEPPHRIENSDIDQTYLRISRLIRERFDYTIRLDDRYKAIALVLIRNQLSEPHIYGGVYRHGEILDLVTQLWPQGFDGITDDSFRGILEEMCGLNVLVRTAEGAYRLRSPNLVRLFGTKDDIYTALNELTRKQPVNRLDADAYHGSLDRSAHSQQYNPLTYAQGRFLNPPHSGVSLVFATEAHGLSRLPQAFRRFLTLAAAEQIGDLSIPPSVIRRQRLAEWLAEQQAAHPQLDQLLFYKLIPSTEPLDLEALVRAGLDYCAQTASKQTVRVIFVFDSPTTAAWLALPETSRVELESRSLATVVLGRWNLQGIHQRLEHHGKLDSQELRRCLLDVTGGWLPLLDEVFQRGDKQIDLSEAITSVAQDLATPESALATQFRAMLGLDTAVAVRDVLRIIQEYGDGQVEIADVTPELLAPIAAYSDADCKLALATIQRLGFGTRQGNTLILEAVIGRMVAQL